MNNTLIILFSEEINSLDLIKSLQSILELRIALVYSNDYYSSPDPLNFDCFIEIRKFIKQSFYVYVLIVPKEKLLKSNLEIIKELSIKLKRDIISHISFIFQDSPKKQDPFYYCLFSPDGKLFEVEETTENLPENYGVILTDYKKEITL